MAVLTTEQEEELEAYHLAYMHLFRTILSKKGLNAERQRQILIKIKQFQVSKIHDIDSYLDHIPEFAKVLAVKPDQLGAFIGSNLLKSLHQVQAQQSQKKKVAAQATKAVNDPSVQKSILKEILLTLGPAVEAPDKFQSVEMGLMSLTANGNVISSASSKNDLASLEAPSTITGKTSGAQPTATIQKEDSLLIEIIELLGSSHEISEKLVVPAFPKDMQAPDLSVPTPATASPTPTSPTKEISILNEIVSTFEKDLKVTEKLVVPAFPAGHSPEPLLDSKDVPPPVTSSGVEGGSILTEIVSLIGSEGGSTEKLVVTNTIPGAQNALGADPMQSTSPSLVEEPAWEPIEFSYGDFDLAIRKLQNYQAKKDGPGYQAWIKGDPTKKLQLMMSLRKFDTAIQQGKEVNIENELSTLSQNGIFHIEQLKDFHKRLRIFARLQKLIAMFIGKVKAQPKPILVGFQKIWPQVKLILNDNNSVEARMHQLKIPMLQISDPKIKQAVMKMMQQLFSKFYEIENS